MPRGAPDGGAETGGLAAGIKERGTIGWTLMRVSAGEWKVLAQRFLPNGDAMVVVGKVLAEGYMMPRRRGVPEY